MADFQKEFTDYDGSLEKSKDVLSGLLGLSIDGQRRVNHETRNGFVYVRLRDNLSEVVQAFNDKVSPVYDFPVIIQRKNNIWVVLGRDTDRYANWGTSAPFLPQHGDQHSFNRDGAGGGDVVWIYPDQFEPLLVYPSGTLGANNVIVAPYMLQRTSDFIWVGNTGTVSLLPYKPTNTQAIMGLVYLDTVSGNPGLLINSGTPFSASLTGSSQIYPYIPYPSSTQESLYAVRLVSGTSTIQWANLYNTRQFVGGGSSSTGSSSGGGIAGISVQDEGSPLGTGTVFNFVGSGVDASISGSVVRIFVTGSSGSLPTFITGSIPFAGSNGILTEDNERLHWDNSNGTLWVGKKPPAIAQQPQVALFMVASGSNTTVTAGGFVFGTGTLGSPTVSWNSYRSRGTYLVLEPLQAGDAIYSIIGAGYDGGFWQNVTRIRSYADGNFITGTSFPSRFDFEVVPSGSATRTVIAELRGDGWNIKNTGTYNVNGSPHTHDYLTLQQAWAYLG